MAPADDPLDESDEALPARPARRRVAMAVGLALLLFILGALAWFVATNTETADDRGRLIGVLLRPPGDVPGTLLSFTAVAGSGSGAPSRTRKDEACERFS